MKNEQSATKSTWQYIVKYATEILVIFIGITISFMFDEWNQGRQKTQQEIAYVESLLTDIAIKKEELKNDSPSALRWIDRLDSIKRNRLSDQLSDKQVAWFYGILSGGDIFFFLASTPSYNTSFSTGMWQDLPDSVRREVYNLFMDDFEYDRMIYTELKATMSNFRNSYMMSYGLLQSGARYGLAGSALKAFRGEIRKQPYENVINEIIIQEKDLYQRNMNSINKIDVVSAMLRNYLSALKNL
ncbi:MAG TPA: DUF6090 family protein [Cyclobacteriaceae bacterium]|nr:DUF6090 family protein [Cyclobacteriaceae bacterium]